MNRFHLLLGLVLALTVAQLAAVTSVVRPSLKNQASEKDQNDQITKHHDHNVYAQGGGNISTAATTEIKASGHFLTESSFGQPFAAFLTPHIGYAESILDGSAGVLAKLYPSISDEGNVRNAIEQSTAAFRYKYLSFGADPSDPNTIINIFEQATGAANWFTDTDRAVVRAQIARLREGLVHDPLNKRLQEALLDTYYDWAVAEAQAARTKLSQLGRLRLDLESPPTGQFIIDAEVTTYEMLVEISGKVIDVYEELFNDKNDGINTSDFDPTAGNAPMGYYIFQKRVPFRNQTMTQFANATGVADVIDPAQPNPEYNDAKPVGPENPQFLSQFNTFAGYKDYRNLLTILGQHLQYQADLARIRGIRMADGDLTKARKSLTDLQAQAGLVCFLDGMFPVDFDSGAFETTGVRGAKNLIQEALVTSSDSRSFLNGTTNHLGLDPDFLLLINNNAVSNKFDSYDILNELILKLESGAPVGPLAIAKKSLSNTGASGELQGAKQAWEAFRGNVDEVIGELSGLEEDYETELVKLTGFKPDDDPGFDGLNPKGGVASDLATLDIEINNLHQRNVTLIELTEQLLKEAADAQKAVSLAKGIEGTITGAQSSYLNDTSGAWTELHAWAGATAGSQALTDGTYALAGVDGISSFFTGGNNAVAILAAGGANTALQTTAAARTSMRQQEIDEAALALDVKIATASLPLTVQQSIMELNALYREGIANKLEHDDNKAALSQALINRKALVRDAARLKERFLIDREVLSTSYFADPIFFARADRAILKADGDFRLAQRWLYYTCRALEYKYQQKFAQDGFDISHILTARNATELEVVRQKMAIFDGNRNIVAQGPNPSPTIISLRDHFLSRNPEDKNLEFTPALINDDSGERKDDDGNLVDKVTHFRSELTKEVDENGNLVIEFDTSLLKNLGSFFRGPNYSGAIPQFGDYRDKIEWIAVHVLAEKGNAEPLLPGLNGGVSYGGNTMFRTRVPVIPQTRQSGVTVDTGKTFKPDDVPGEYVIAPFRYYQSTNLTNTFQLFPSKDVTATFATSTTSARDTSSATNMQLSSAAGGYRRTDFKELSVAATCMRIQINAGNFDIDNINDIEILVQHQSYARPAINLP